MTATPIPRTIGLTLYAELDMSILDELPKGRKPVKTYVVTPLKQKAAYEWINKKIINSPKGQNQAYIIFPLIEESENLHDIKAATKEFTRLKNEIFPKLRLEILHGKIKPNEKNRIIDKFHKGLLDILVATSVVEVGMDIPGATIIVVENADRFGLAQLHQLRGRVGRNDRESYCLLFSDKPGSRLYALTKNYSGLKLAEIDSKIRGIGDIYGIKQHGRLALKIADITDHQLIEKARNQAVKLVETDSSLNEYQNLLNYIKPYLDLEVKPD
jgi:ATP-dependent DNA helicase RecG